jgi:hypothetical protein
MSHINPFFPFYYPPVYMVLQVVIVFSTEFSVCLRILFLLDVTLNHGIRDATAQQCIVIVEDQTFHTDI